MSELTALLLEEKPGEMMRLRKNGSSGEIAMLLGAAMETNREVASAVLAAAINYCKDNGISLEQLSRMENG